MEDDFFFVPKEAEERLFLQGQDLNFFALFFTQPFPRFVKGLSEGGSCHTTLPLLSSISKMVERFEKKHEDEKSLDVSSCEEKPCACILNQEHLRTN